MNFDNSWLLILLWMLLFLLDDWLTISVARSYDDQDPRIIEFEGGYELTPRYKEEIANHELFGPKFRLSLFSFSAFFIVFKLLTIITYLPTMLFTFIMGAAILLSCTVNIRHAQNLVFFGLVKSPGMPRGEIFYPGSFTYRASAVGFLAFGVFFLLLSVILGSWFLFGGVFTNVGTGLAHWRMSTIMVSPADPGQGPD